LSLIEIFNRQIFVRTFMIRISLHNISPNIHWMLVAFSGPCRSAFRPHDDRRSGIMSIAVPEHVDHFRMTPLGL
jgi:hypothetical protein